jgi:K(+)-stimulated pyrophosphate-energized sodium pump
MVVASLFAVVVGVVVLAVAGYLTRSVLKQPQGNQQMKDVAKAISDGAQAYLKRQYTTLLPFVIVLALAIGFFVTPVVGLAFVAGVIASALAGYIGMMVSVRANVRTTEAAKRGVPHAVWVAARGGAVTGLSLVGLGLIGVGGLYYLTGSGIVPNLSALIGFGFGASLISLFARVGGGIYTKAADVGADLVGKVEKGIPEDDARNPAVIADNVGDNVGDCAGMAADLFESFVVTIIAAMLLGSTLGQPFVELPLLIASAGALGSVIGIFFIKVGKSGKIMSALYKGVGGAAIFAAWGFLAVTFSVPLLLCALVGVILTLLIGVITEYYTAKEYSPVQEVAAAAKSGAGTNLISGLAVGMQSTALPVVVVVLAIMASYVLSGLYGIAIAAAGMLSLTGIIITLDAFGPITDNAGGIAEMSGAPESVRKVTDALDSVGNTTKATTKGFAIAGAALGALALFAAFSQSVQLTTINLLEPTVVIGLLIGGALPFLFSSFLMKAVGRAAFQIVEEVRRQFREIKGIMSGKAKPDYAMCVDISTKAALNELMAPALLAVASPIVVGLLLGPEALGGMLAGAIVSGFLMALFMSNSGAAWDNAKKFIEDGHYGGKGSDTHKAAVVGDTVGDPFKDTAGPSLNSLIKVLNTVALLSAGIIMAFSLHLLG